MNKRGHVQPAPETLTVTEAGRLLGLSRYAAYAAANRGDLPVLRIGLRLLVLRRPFERMLEGELVLRPQHQGTEQ